MLKKKGIKSSKFKSFCQDSKSIELLFPSEREAKRFARFNDVTAENTERYYYCITCKGWHLTQPLGNKPRKNRFFCHDSRKIKMLFSTEKKASNFIKFNSTEIEDEKGNSPERSYFCLACCGWHTTSQKEVPDRKSKTERLLEQAEYNKWAKISEEKKSEMAFDAIEAKIKRLENSFKASIELRTRILERILVKFEQINSNTKGTFKKRKETIASRLNALSIKIKGVYYSTEDADQEAPKGMSAHLKNIELRIKKLESTYVVDSHEINKQVLTKLKKDFESIELDEELSKTQQNRVNKIASKLLSMKKRIVVAGRERKIVDKEILLQERSRIRTDITSLFAKIESNIAFLETATTVHHISIIAFIYDSLYALDNLFQVYTKNLSCDHLRSDVTRIMLVNSMRKKELEDRVSVLISEIKNNN